MVSTVTRTLIPRIPVIPPPNRLQTPGSYSTRLPSATP
ncbi:hypothetical protein COLO4_35401 [Corchorus olitorius]|uniref:Uncharacterized protein n=1 Tax=Corchorus olitorius TaxID=93759 RepID=A0A1R3GH54_9ROSI|nr:hypothetical protein COLO4_35401 [Corchorus olitorius]